MTRPPLPPFTFESATQKVRIAEDGWNSRDAAKVTHAYTIMAKIASYIERIEPIIIKNHNSNI